jgi:uncharacterized sporulation protein YeaH/YhbH (DUF444 family)
MTRRVDEDQKQFRDVISGKANKSLKRYQSTGLIYRLRSKNGRIAIPVDKILIPHVEFGENSIGIGRGPGRASEIIGKDPQQGKGNKAGEEHSEGIELEIDLEVVLKFMKEDLQLPNLKPKDQDFDEIEYKYNSLSLTGPHALLHRKKTLLTALRRLIMSGQSDILHEIPGFKDKVKLITPINNDFRYRQYTEVKKPSSNAVIFFARDCSGSMSEYKCDIVSDMSWWIDTWIRSFYKRTERLYVVHDTDAEEVDEDKFYKYRYGGGTKCSSSLKFIADNFKHRFPANKWNIYCFYFSDGENFDNDNQVFCDTIKKEFPPDVCNLIGITQVLCWNYKDSLKQYIDGKIKSKYLNNEYVRTVSIGKEQEQTGYAIGSYSSTFSEEERNGHVRNAIKVLLGKQKA